MRTSKGSLRRRSSLAAFSLIFVAAGLFGAASAPGDKKPPKFHPPPPRTLPDKVERLAQQLLTVPLDESDPITSQIQQLVVGHLQDWIAGHAPASPPSDVPYDVRVRQETEKAFSELQYPLVAQCVAFAQPWHGATLTGAAYTLGWSDYDRVNAVALFETRDGKTHLAGVDQFVPRADLHYAFLPSPDPASFRFLVYGTRLGKSQTRLSATLYGYDGHTLKSLWQVRDMYDGKLELENNSVVIRYLKEEEYVQEQTYHRKPPRHMAIYKTSPQGLTLASDRDIPF